MSVVVSLAVGLLAAVVALGPGAGAQSGEVPTPEDPGVAGIEDLEPAPEPVEVVPDQYVVSLDDAVAPEDVPEVAQALAIIAEHGVYALVGRSESNEVRAVHASDPLLVDLLVQRFGEVLGARLFD